MEGENHELLKTKTKCMLEPKTFETPLTLLSVTTKRERNVITQQLRKVRHTIRKKQSEGGP